jgi:hypothetical protein
MIEKERFRKFTLEEEENIKTFKVVSVKMNREEYYKLQDMKKILEQPKDSTALKFLGVLGAEVVLEQKTRIIIEALFKNKKNNQRTGLTEF